MFVNGCTIEEINIERDLKQGDPLAHFIFLLVVKGLNVTLNKTVTIKAFYGFKVGFEGLIVSHIQYPDDAVLFG